MRTELVAGYLAFVVLASIYRINRLIRSYERPVGCRGKVYSPATYTVLLVLYLCIFLISVMEFFIVRSRSGINWAVSLLGLATYVAVIPVREKAIHFLGDNMSPEIEIKRTHKLITEGPYSYVRHPLAMCVLLELAGFTLVSNSYYAFGGVILVFFPFIYIRVYLEEKALIEKFGDQYLEYKKQVFAMLPLKNIKHKPSEQV